MNRHVRLYRVLLALYPPSFQREYAPDLVQAFTDLARDRGLASTWARCSVDLAVTIPRLHMEALVHRYVPSSALAALVVLIVGLAGFAGVALGGVAAVPLLLMGAVLAASQRTALAQSLVIRPDQRHARLRMASILAVVCATAIGSWVYHINRYDDLGDTTVLLHNLVGLLSFVGAIGFGLAGLFTRTPVLEHGRE